MLFAKQCSLISNHSKLPSIFRYLTEKSLSTIKFSCSNIIDIIEQLYSNKAHSHDMTNIRMLKICRKIFCRPLELIFNEWFSNGVFASDWKKGNAVLILNKNDRRRLENNRSFSLLICGKVVEHFIFNEMFSFFY